MNLDGKDATGLAILSLTSQVVGSRGRRFGAMGGGKGKMPALPDLPVFWGGVGTGYRDGGGRLGAAAAVVTPSLSNLGPPPVRNWVDSTGSPNN